MKKKYLIVECTELNDQYECDANRTPICVVEDYTPFNRYGFDIWLIQESGSLIQIKDYTDDFIH